MQATLVSKFLLWASGLSHLWDRDRDRNRAHTSKAFQPRAWLLGYEPSNSCPLWFEGCSRGVLSPIPWTALYALAELAVEARGHLQVWSHRCLQWRATGVHRNQQHLLFLPNTWPAVPPSPFPLSLPSDVHLCPMQPVCLRGCWTPQSSRWP